MANDSEITLILAPTENDAAVAVRILGEDGLKAETCGNIKELCARIERGCGAIVIAEEALPIGELPILQKCLSSQEPWSDLPVILLTGKTASESLESFLASGNISLLERPFSRLILTRAIEVALRARRRQYLVRQLFEQQRQAAQKRDEFFATLSHELRTPLNVILGWVEILLSGGLRREAELAALDVLERNAKLQQSLIDDLLDTSRIITGKLHFERAPVSLTKLVKSAQLAFGPRANGKKISLEVHAPDADCVVFGDEVRLTQAISNLLTNALKFTPNGGNVVMKLDCSPEIVTLSVKDNGQGMDPQFLPSVFDRLKQEDMSTTRSHGGLGLGLAITAHIIEQHDGSIEAKSEGRGKGAEFLLRLPVHEKSGRQNFESPGARPSEMIAGNRASLRGVKVLVVDDSPDILQLIQLWLTKARAEVIVAHSASEAIAKLPTVQPDVLISDIGMPIVDGYQLISQVRALSESKLRDVPAVALTAYAKDEERAKALSAGFQMHISKPISNDQLITAVKSLVGRE